jgi:hypothetical protein
VYASEVTAANESAGDGEAGVVVTERSLMSAPLEVANAVPERVRALAESEVNDAKTLPPAEVPDT